MSIETYLCCDVCGKKLKVDLFLGETEDADEKKLKNDGWVLNFETSICPECTKIHVKSITKTCEACPAQWYATKSNGENMYIRYRFGYLMVCGYNKQGELDLEDIIFEKKIGHEFAGDMSTQELISILPKELFNFVNCKVVEK